MDKDRKALEALLRSLELDAAIRGIELPAPTELEEALDSLKKQGQIITKSGRMDGRRLAGKKRAKKNAQRKAHCVRQQRWERKWKERGIKQAMDGNYFEYISRRWKKKQRQWLISEAEWLEYVQPSIPTDCFIDVRRYETNKPTTLDNIVVFNSATGDVLFDGAEWYLKQQGYTL